ncbi:M16 family metallopeptidase [Arsukibacterium perlucidum]|uniref:M16 family metallopeptidase n=1 Tax=Arsukibacterium perlucidum TaxID=368811 RepID=UPI0003729119|nr:insulinase family protein [Arsukibacterium perlucidum]
MHKLTAPVSLTSGKLSRAILAAILSVLLIWAFATRFTQAVFEPELYDPKTVFRYAATAQRPEIIILPEVNSQHANKARVKLVVGAGALQEKGEQRGLAHFVEHMAFRGTKAYPEQQIQQRMRELGIQLGRHSNAYTTFDHTAYWMDLNDLNRNQLDASLDILAQWAYDIEFSDAAVAEEIAVIVEEWRLQQQDQERVQPRLLKVLLNGSRQQERFPVLGDRPSIEATTVEKLREFYQQWYHPENMLVVVSGDIEPEQTLQQIERYFVRTDIVSERLLPAHYDIKPSAIPDFTILSDPYTPIAALNMLWFYPNPEYSEANERQTIALEFALGVLRNRLANKQLSSNGIVAGANVQRNRQSAGVRALNMTLMLTEPDFALAYNHLEYELQRLLALGISADEWQTQLSGWHSWLQNLQDSPGRLAGLARDFWLYQAPIVNQRSHQQRRQALLQAITPEEAIQALAQVTSGRHITVVFYPHGTAAPTAEQLTEYRLMAQQRPHAPVLHSKQPQWQDLPPSSGIVSEKKQPEGIIEWQLANGITAYYRHSDDMPGRVYLRLTAKNGTNQLPDEQVAVARLASEVISDGGQAGLNSTELQQWRQALDITHSFYIDLEERSFYQAAPLEHIDQALLDLLHRLQSYQLDAELWQFKQAQALQLQEQFKQHPHFPWYQAWNATLWQDDIRYRELSSAEIEATSLRQAQTFYQQWIQGNQGYQLALVGDITPEHALKLVEKYFASLPKAQPQGKGRFSPQPYEAKQVRLAGSGEKHASISLRYYLEKAQLPQAWQDTSGTLLTYWLNEQLFDRIRTQSGLTYSITAEIAGSRPANALISLNISLQTGPDKVDEAIAQVTRLLSEAAAHAPTEQQVRVWHQSLADERLQARKRSRWLLNRIGFSEVLQSTPWQRIAPLAEPPAADSLQQLLLQIVEQGHLVELVWLP